MTTATTRGPKTTSFFVDASDLDANDLDANDIVHRLDLSIAGVRTDVDGSGTYATYIFSAAAPKR